jgi:hypothetical protein
VFTIMDQEIHPEAEHQSAGRITGVHRQTVAARLKQLEPALGSNNKLKLYLITDVLTELMAPVVASSAEDMTPSDRLAHWKAENERLKFEQDTGQLIPLMRWPVNFCHGESCGAGAGNVTGYSGA